MGTTAPSRSPRRAGEARARIAASGTAPARRAARRGEPRRHRAPVPARTSGSFPEMCVCGPWAPSLVSVAWFPKKVALRPMYRTMYRAPLRFEPTSRDGTCWWEPWACMACLARTRHFLAAFPRVVYAQPELTPLEPRRRAASKGPTRLRRRAHEDHHGALAAARAAGGFELRSGASVQTEHGLHETAVGFAVDRNDARETSRPLV